MASFDEQPAQTFSPVAWVNKHFGDVGGDLSIGQTPHETDYLFALDDNQRGP